MRGLKPEDNYQFFLDDLDATHLPGPLVDMLVQSRGSVPTLPADVAVDAVPGLLGRPL
ncbi:hypothetical protein AB0C29_13510 [Actinoplanes sp. NPDC048791]|uniref:hypothetical protein n=1 Tax=Actinoplanes sp. NPDC048791 TaxID=3154623 RepID=UPI0033C63BD1